MKVYIAKKYYPDGRNLGLVRKLKEILKQLGHDSYCFSEKGYIKDDKELMLKALQKVDECDVLLAEASDSSFGVGIETGYAYSKNKKIITIFQESFSPSRTIKGIANFCVSYKEVTDLKEKLKELLY